MTSRRLVVAAILVDDLVRPRSVMAARRSTPPHLAGLWEFPGGKVEPGEDPEAALRRELVEELSVDVTLGSEVRPPGGGAWPVSEVLELRTWLAQITNGSPTPDSSHDAVRWLDRAGCTSLEWLAADRAVAASVVDLMSGSVGQQRQ